MWSLFGMLFYGKQGYVTACTIANKCKYNHVTPILKLLNWLPVNDQLYFRNAVLAFKCMSGLAPGHLSDQLITCRTVKVTGKPEIQRCQISVYLGLLLGRKHSTIGLSTFGII